MICVFLVARNAHLIFWINHNRNIMYFHSVSWVYPSNILTFLLSELKWFGLTLSLKKNKNSLSTRYFDCSYIVYTITCPWDPVFSNWHIFAHFDLWHNNRGFINVIGRYYAHIFWLLCLRWGTRVTMWWWNIDKQCSTGIVILLVFL